MPRDYDRVVEDVRFSFVLPVFNEEDTLEELHRRLSAVLESLDETVEIVFIDDGSTDGSSRILEDLKLRDRRIRTITLARNFGHQIAISAGIDHALGEAIVIMDTDLQDPPELIPELIRRWQEGYDVVYAVRERRHGDSWLKRASASAFYRVLSSSSEIQSPLDAGDFRLVDRRAANVFRSLRERDRYVRGMFSWIGLRQTGVPFVRDERFAGTPKYSYRDSLKLALNGLVSFSVGPLRLALAVGVAVAAVAIGIGAFAIIARFAGFYSLPGWASIVVVVSFVGAVQLILTSVVGIYVGRIYNEVKARPLYVVDNATLTPRRSSPEAEDG